MTTNSTATTAAIHYHAGYNMPGYMPESDVDTYADIEEAIDGMIETLRYHLDSIEPWSGEHDCDDIPCPTYGDDCSWNKARELESAADCLAGDSDAIGGGQGWSYRTSALVYWINPCTDDCTIITNSQPRPLPTVAFAESGDIDAGHAAYVAEVGGTYEVRVRHPQGGYVFAGYFGTQRDGAEAVSGSLNDAIGSWGRLSQGKGD